jgi:NET1-associated nuclear protein 1 (U3 small nucleolar RNA-associated protein 17)
VLFELEISPSNRVSRREDAPVEPSRVTSCVLSATGHWMATIDKRETSADGFRGEVCLKLWWWDMNAGHWILNTRINRPHGLHTVTSLAFDPSLADPHSSQLITTGDDGTVKAWRIRSTTEKDGAIEREPSSVLIVFYLLIQSCA